MGTDKQDRDPKTPRGQLATSESTSTARLRKALRGQVPEIRPIEALHELRARGAPRLSAILVEIVAGEDDIDLRATAAQALGRKRTAKHREALLKALDDDEPEVVRRAVESLGRIGGERELERLQALRPRDPVVKRAVETARTLLSYRTGSKGGRLSAPEASQVLDPGRAKTREISVKPVSAKTLEDLTEHLQRELPALPVASVAHTIDCGTAEYLLVFHDALSRGKGADVLSEGSAIPAALLRRAEVDGTYYLTAHVLTHPGRGKSAHVFVLSTSGQTLYYGEVTTGPERARFSIAALNTRHTRPMALEGTLGYEALDIRLERGLVATEKAVVQPVPKRPRQIRTAPE